MKGCSSRSTKTERNVHDKSYYGGGNAGTKDRSVLSFVTNLLKPTSAAAKLSVSDLLSLTPKGKNQIDEYRDNLPMPNRRNQNIRNLLLQLKK